MTTATAAPIDFKRSHAVSQPGWHHLAGTFRDSHHPVWIHDLAGRCVYSNPVALHAVEGEGTEAVQDILDYRNQRVGVLRIRLS